MWSPKSGWADAKYVCYIKENIYANINTKTSFSFQNVCNKHNNAEIVITDLSYIRKLEKHSVTFLFQVLESNKLTPIKLGPKEGIALINGTQLITALGVEGIGNLRLESECKIKHLR